jgi:hypothetical protein
MQAVAEALHLCAVFTAALCEKREKKEIKL